MKDGKNILIFGAGAIGTTLGYWLEKSSANITLYDKPETVKTITKNGLSCYPQGTLNSQQRINIQATASLDEVPTPDIIVLCVKNYSLDSVCSTLNEKFGSKVLVVGLQNGIENQSILPKYFEHVVYGVVCYNAWMDEIGKVGYQKKGPVVLGHKGGVSAKQISEVANIFNEGVETHISNHIDDAAHSKIIINLVNSLTTLVASHQQDLSKNRKFQKLLSRMTYEGVQVMKSAGFSECKLGGMPSWSLITAAAKLPAFVTTIPYRKNLKKMVISSMAQDVIANGTNNSELESINGYVLSLAKTKGLKVPVNEAVFKLCQQTFERKDFEPLTVDTVWQKTYN